ncbi:MAG: DNA polymerase I [Candidatus Omnitrophica bacterium]|nr:DNA polymerase I [Candidatus Omnitrophota bacterium]MBU4457214.1 DNA polymerase I [Candidatus Omnitrophota bacterium]
MKKKKLFLIDGNSYCYRAYYAIKELRNSKGQPTNAIYGFVLMLKKLLSSENPDYLAVAFDLKGPTFRHKKFKEYKIKRKPMPDDLVSQLPLIKEVVRSYNIPIFEKEGFEADDVLATIAKKAAKKDIEVCIVTGDKDILQLIDDNIKVYSTHKEGLVYDKENVRERFSGLGPESITDFMALAGDQSDNIPGVRGIGEKTAIELIKEFHDIDNLYKHLDRVKSDSKKKILVEGEESARMSKELAVVDVNVPIEVDIESMQMEEPDSKKLLELFKAFEFKAFAKEIAGDDPGIRREASYKTIVDKDEFDKFLKELKKQEEFVLDFETTSENPLEAVPIGVSFCWKPGSAYYIVLDAVSAKRKAQSAKQGIDIKIAFEQLKPILEDEKIRKIGQNIKYEKLILSNYGIELKGIYFDTMIASYLLNPSKMNHNLDDLAFEHLNHKMISMSDLVGTGKKKIGMDQVPLDRISEYSCEDSDATLRLKEVFEKELFDKELDKLFKKIELPLIDVLSEMEKNGVKIDTELLKKTSMEIEKELQDLVNSIYKIAGKEFNINSPKQLSQILFEDLQLPVIKKTKTGYSTDVGVLQRLALEHPLPKEILRYRELSKLKSTYVDALPELVNPRTGRLHTSFNQTITATGRLSSSNPNLQNIPIKTEQARRIRKAFIGEKGNLILSCDYSQIELRILAHLSGDEELMSAFEKDKDVHVHTASLIFDVKEKDVSPQQRSSAKTVNFGIVYGISAFGLSRSLYTDPASAQQFIDSYFERYPRVKMYMEDKIEEARDTGYVTTLFNRRRYVPEINTGALREQQQAERIAINAPIQGSAADLIKIAMIDIHNEIKKKGLSSIMTLQVHDELVFEVPEKEMKVMQELVKTRMEQAVKLSVPVKVSVKYGKNWMEMEESI